jgi:hypothetical protein
MKPAAIIQLERDVAAFPQVTSDSLRYERARLTQISKRRTLGQHEAAFLQVVEDELNGADELRLCIGLRRATEAMLDFVKHGPRRRRRRFAN